MTGARPLALGLSDLTVLETDLARGGRRLRNTPRNCCAWLLKRILSPIASYTPLKDTMAGCGSALPPTLGGCLRNNLSAKQMITILIDHNIEGHALRVWDALQAQGWSDVIFLNMLTSPATALACRRQRHFWQRTAFPHRQFLTAKACACDNPTT